MSLTHSFLRNCGLVVKTFDERMLLVLSFDVIHYNDVDIIKSIRSKKYFSAKTTIMPRGGDT